MKQRLSWISRRLWQLFLGREFSQFLIKLISELARVNLLTLAYKQMGILNYENAHLSGEEYVIKQVLSRYITGPEPFFFDVGANQGEYSLELRSNFPEAHIFAFEPNPYTFKILKSKLNLPKDQCYCLGLGSVQKRQAIYTYSDSLDSQHASVYQEVFRDIHHAVGFTNIEIEITTIDKLCAENNIKWIDFLKIDTEGNELDVLKGASSMIAEDRIRVIQFEFNEMNVISRVFLRDFYSLLKDFDFFRLNTRRLIPLPQYDSTYEIFKFQNFLAINKHTQVHKQ